MLAVIFIHLILQIYGTCINASNSSSPNSQPRVDEMGLISFESGQGGKLLYSDSQSELSSEYENISYLSATSVTQLVDELHSRLPKLSDQDAMGLNQLQELRSTASEEFWSEHTNITDVCLRIMASNNDEVALCVDWLKNTLNGTMDAQSAQTIRGLKKMRDILRDYYFRYVTDECSFPSDMSIKGSNYSSDGDSLPCGGWGSHVDIGSTPSPNAFKPEDNQISEEDKEDNSRDFTGGIELDFSALNGKLPFDERPISLHAKVTKSPPPNVLRNYYCRYTIGGPFRLVPFHIRIAMPFEAGITEFGSIPEEDDPDLVE